MPKAKPSFLDKVLAHTERRPRLSDSWPAQLKAEIDEALKLRIAGDNRHGLRPQCMARMIVDALVEAGHPENSISQVKRYIEWRLAELRRG